MRIQLCAILSQLNKHEAAQYHAKKAAKYADNVVAETHRVCSEHLKRHKKLLASGRLKSKALERPQYQLMESPHYQQFHDAVQKTFPVLESLTQRLGPKRSNTGKAPKLDLRSVLGVQHYNDWIYSYNIGDLMVVEPLEMAELKSNMGLQVELTRDMMLDKVCLLAAAYFCVATEIRFLNNQKGGSGGKEREGEAWHGKAMRVARDFLPLECPLANHIKQSYTRNYGEVTVKKTRASVRPVVSHLEGSIRGRKSPHPEKSPLAAAKEIVKEMLGRPRSTSGRGVKKQSPKKRIGEVSPKPITKPVRPVPGYPAKRLAPETKARADFVPKDVRTETEYEEEIEPQPYFAQGEGVKSVPSLGGDNPIGTGNREKDTTLGTEEDEEIMVESVRPEALEDADSEESYRDEIVISSNELYGVESESEDFEDEEKGSWREEELPVGKEKRFEQFRPISSTGGHS